MPRTRFVDRHPYWFVALLEAVVIIVYLFSGAIAHVLGMGGLGLYFIANVALTLLAAILLTIMGWWRATGMWRAARPRDLLWYLVPALPLVINLIPGVQIGSWAFLGQMLAIALLVGFTEESIFRGLMLRALTDRGPWRAAIITALLFGLTHSMNILSGKSAFEAALQIGYALAIGFGYAALVLNKGLVWPLVIAHAAIDLSNYIQRPGYAWAPVWDVVSALGIIVVFVAYGLWVMLRGEKQLQSDHNREIVR